MSNTSVELRDQIREEIEALSGSSVSDVNQEIFKSGILDSLNVLNIISFIESKFEITVDTFDISLETLDSIEKIALYVESKRA